MFLNTRFFVLVLIIVLMLWKVSESNKPAIIRPSQEEIILNEGDTLEIICSGDTPIRFIYPNTTDAINTSTSKTNETEKNGIYQFVFQRPNTVFGDTGWYGCADYNVDIIPNNYDNPEVNWLYIYVKSSMHFFVEADTYAHLHAIVGNDIAIPCRITSPDLVPILYKNNSIHGMSYKKMDKPFNPKIGFIMKNLIMEDSDLYKCSIETTGEILEEINYILYVQQILPKPIILIDESNFHVTRGEDLYVNCTVQVDKSMRYVFSWITLQQNSKRIRTQYFRKDVDEKNVEVTCQLTIFNVTNEDAGKYECSIRSDDHMEKTMINITIHDVRRKYINLRSEHSTRFYQRKVGSSVEWLVFFDGYPKPQLQWKKYDLNITTEDNFSVNTTSTFTILKIKSLRQMDAGVYTLVAKNRYRTEKLNFTLKVADKPISKLVNVKSYYAPNENAEFYCIALSLRTVTFSNITWNFLKCLDFPLCKNFTIIQPTNVIEMEQASFMFYKNYTSKVKMSIEMPGKIKCEACNAVGCGVSIKTVLVSDGIGNFSIIRPKEPVIKDDDIEFTCVASVYYFTNKLRWENLNNTLIVESDRLHIMQYKTLFTHRSTVKINNVQKSDIMAYICVGESTSLDTIVDETYKLVVHDPVKPFFYNTNMNQTKVKDIDINTDDYNTLILKCFVNGVPKPNMTWFKDNTTLMEDNQYSFKSDNQELNIKYLKKNDSGKYLCRATNRFGTNETYQQIRISGNKNAVDNFYIISPNESVIKGDNIDLTCVASVFFYTDELAWVNFTKTVSEELHTVPNNTLFFYRLTLKIYNVQESDAKNYTCAGKYIISNNNNTFSTLKEFKHYELVIHDPVPPYFYKTNMNKTIATKIQIFQESHKNVTLQCFAKGMPTPLVTWLKDNIPLKENNQYSFKFDNQELNIKYFEQYDSGKYLCRATNRFGTNETYQHIIIENVKFSEQKFDAILTTSIAILGIILIILGIFITIKVRREKRLKRELIETGLMHFVDGALECINPDLTIDDQAELLPYDKKWEFPRERLKLGKQLGSGAFGVVMKAEAHRICKNEIVTTVAVKMVRRTTDITCVRALASELKIMIHLGKHLNVVNLLGACTKNISKRELLVIVEYCCFGNLHNYLFKHRSNFINNIDSKSGKIVHNSTNTLTKMASINNSNNSSNSLNSGSDTATYQCSKTVSTYCAETSFSSDTYVFSDKSESNWRSNYRGNCNDQNFKPICTQDLLSWAFQVGRGMEYLSQRRVLHGDLAARNILLTEDNIVKICDFGLAKSMYKDGDYQKKGAGILPIKWMAIESIKDYIFSTQSDIWSFGIMLWEFFTLAETPYPGIDVERLYSKLIEGYRMEQPKYANREIYDIMLQCWKAEPILRPSFTNLVQSIGNLMEESVKSYYTNLNMPYMNTNTMILENGKPDYLTLMCVPHYAILSSARQDYVKSEQAVSEDASNSCMSVDSHIDKSLIFSPRPHQDHSELSSFASDLQEALNLLPAKQTDESKSIVHVSAEQIDSKNNDFVSIIHTPDNQYVETKKRSEKEYAG